MKSHADMEKIRTTLKEAIMLLCKSSLNFQSEFSVEGLLGVTLDCQEVFLVKISETFQLNGDSICDNDLELESDDLKDRLRDIQKQRYSFTSDSDAEESSHVSTKFEDCGADDISPKQLEQGMNGCISQNQQQPYMSSDEAKNSVEEPSDADTASSSNGESYDLQMQKSSYISEGNSGVSRINLPVLNIPNAPRRLLIPHSSKRLEKSKKYAIHRETNSSESHCKDNSVDQSSEERCQSYHHDEEDDSPLDLQLRQSDQVPSPVSKIKVEPVYSTQDDSNVSDKPLQQDLTDQHQLMRAAALSMAGHGFLSQQPSSSSLLYPPRTHPSFMIGGIDVHQNWRHSLDSYIHGLHDFSQLNQLTSAVAPSRVRQFTLSFS